MTVAELIEKLRGMPQDAQVFRLNRDNEYGAELDDWIQVELHLHGIGRPYVVIA